MAGMEQAGMEFSTYDDGTSRVQVSGEFRELERRAPTGLKYFALWEPQGDRVNVGEDARDVWVGMVGDNGALGNGLSAHGALLPRTHAMACDGQAWEVTPAKKLRARAPVFDFNGWGEVLRPKRQWLHKLPRGMVALVAESSKTAARAIVGLRFTSYVLSFPSNMALMQRVWAPATGPVKVLRVDPVTQASKVLLEFVPFCGVSPALADLTAAADLSDALAAEPGLDPATDEYVIRPLLWHKDGDPATRYYPNKMRLGPWAGVSWIDQRRPAHYDVSTPALVKAGSDTHLAVTAVFASQADALYPDGSGVASLRTLRTTGAEPAAGTLTWSNPEGWGAEFYAAAAQMYLHRANSTRLFLLLRTLRQLRPGQAWETEVITGGTTVVKTPSDPQYSAPANDLRMLWSNNNGQDWTEFPVASIRTAFGNDAVATDVMAPDGQGGVWLAAQQRRTVSFSPTTTPLYGQLNTYKFLRAAPGSLTPVVEVTDEQLYQHLYPGAPRASSPRSNLWEVAAFRHWAAWRVSMGWYNAGAAATLNDPRTTLIVAQWDGAAWSWSLRNLPVVDARAAVRIFAVDEKTLGAIVVQGTPRYNNPIYDGSAFDYDGAINARMKGVLYLSTNKGATWKREPIDPFALPAHAQLDGTYHTALRQVLASSVGDLRANTSINVPSELLGPVVMETPNGRDAPIFPAMPWLYDQTIEEPTP